MGLKPKIRIYKPGLKPGAIDTMLKKDIKEGASALYIKIKYESNHQ